MGAVFAELPSVGFHRCSALCVGSLAPRRQLSACLEESAGPPLGHLGCLWLDQIFGFCGGKKTSSDVLTCFPEPREQCISLRKSPASIPALRGSSTH